MSAPPIQSEEQAKARTAIVTRPPGILLALGILIWSAVVLASYYPRPLQALLHTLGLSTGPWLPPLSGIILPTAVSLARLAEVIWALGCTAFLAVTATAFGWRLMQALRLGTTGFAENLLFSCALGLGGIAYVGLLLAGMQLLMRPALVMVALLLGLHAVAWVSTSPWRLSEAPDGRLPQQTAVAEGLAMSRDKTPRESRRPVLAALTGAMLGLFGLTALVVALAPEVEFDALWYHLFLPQQHLLAGELVDIPHEWVSLYPQTVELLFGVGLAWGGPIAAKLVHFLFGSLNVGATYLLARRWLAPVDALFAALIFVSVPSAHWEFTTANIDLAIALFTSLSLLELIGWWAGGDNRRVIRAALMLGLALASKHLGLLLLPVAMLIVLLGLVLGEERTQSTTIHGIGRLFVTRLVGFLTRPQHCALLVAFPIVAFALAAPWYLRSWLKTGNPVFPMLYSIFGGPPNRWNAANERGFALLVERNFGLGRDPTTLLALPWHMTTAADRFGGSIGPLFLIALPGIVLLFLVRRSTSLWVLGLWVLSSFALWASPISSFQARFLLVIMPPLAILAALGLKVLAEQLQTSGWTRLAAGVVPAAVFILVFHLPFFIPWHSTFPVAATLYDDIDVGAIVDRQAAEAYTARHVPGYGAARFANEYLPDESRILTLVEGFHFYSDQPLLLWHAALAQPATVARPNGKPEAVLDALGELKITHILMPRNLEEPRRLGMILAEDEFIQQHLKPIYHDDQTVLFVVGR